jgi:glycerol-3-phosphate dehydrogenase
MAHTRTLKTDALIFGGGVAGLWILNRLRQAGYNAWLFEQDRLGTGQTIASQGIIHSGLKYVHDGSLNKAAVAIADMPQRWRDCLAGTGEIDLSETRVLSEHYYMLPRASWRARLLSFLGSKALASRTESVKAQDYPPLFAGQTRSPLYRLDDFVVDVPSLLQTLSDRQASAVFSINWDQARLTCTDKGDVDALVLADDTRIEASRYIFCCGSGNAALLSQFGITAPAMQKRPLQQVMVRHTIETPAFVHCVSSSIDLTPELTITTHRNSAGQPLWYLGGRLAENGVGKSTDVLIGEARAALETLLPWCDFTAAAWGTLSVDRAELQQPDGRRPEHGSLSNHGNVAVCWPTKLTLSPALADAVLAHFDTAGIKPLPDNTVPPAGLTRPAVAATPWESL